MTLSRLLELEEKKSQTVNITREKVGKIRLFQAT